jgi:hypothetical protein
MITILNIQNDAYKMSGSYAFVYVTTIIVYFQIIRFWRQTSGWGDKNFEKGKEMYFSELKNYVVLVKGIPENINSEVGSLEIQRILKRCYGSELIDFKICGEYTELYKLGKSWLDLQKSYKFVHSHEKLLRLYEQEQQMKLQTSVNTRKKHKSLKEQV